VVSLPLASFEESRCDVVSYIVLAFARHLLIAGLPSIKKIIMFLPLISVQTSIVTVAL
jgi:hypothetical protein